MIFIIFDILIPVSYSQMYKGKLTKLTSTPTPSLND